MILIMTDRKYYNDDHDDYCRDCNDCDYDVVAIDDLIHHIIL